MRISTIFVLILSFFLLYGKEVPLAQAAEAPRAQEPTILAPDGLKTREQKELERRYRYRFRRKEILLGPQIATGFAEEPAITPLLEVEVLTEQEKLYRYFGIATTLYEIGRLEEAAEILKYILLKRPDDEYVKGYLRDIQEELGHKKIKWRTTSREDALLLKKIKTKELMKDGIAYYKQERFDMALLKFANALTLDPDNSIAKRYIDKLRSYYRNEVGIENIVAQWEVEMAGREEEEIQIFNEFKEEDTSPNRKKVAERLLDREEMESAVKYARLNSLMEQAELDLKIEEIISQRMEEERKRYSYTLGPGDEIQISVQDHPELSGRTNVGLEGYVMLPLVNEPVMAQDLALSELQEKVVGVLERYVKDPIIYVGIVSYQSKVFYVIDEEGCTPYNITRADFTLRDALFISDWGEDRALGRVLVVKPHKLHPVVKKVDAFDLVYRGNLAQNIRIESGDVVYVPMTAASKITQTIADMLSPIKAVRDVREEWLAQRWNLQQGWYNLPRIPRTRGQQSDYREINVSSD